MSASNQITENFPLPLGIILPYASTVAPIPYGFLLCNGAQVSKALYPELYALLGDTWGASTATDFFLPDMVNKYFRGVAANTGNSVPASITGTITWTLTENNMPVIPLSKGNLAFTGSTGNGIVHQPVGKHTDVQVSSGGGPTGQLNQSLEFYSTGTVVFNSMTLNSVAFANTPITYDLATHFGDVQLGGYGMAYIIKAKNPL
jgi:microcystin-dependent protein